MSIDNFIGMNENEKVRLIFDADKVIEKIDDEAKYQLFKIDNFYVETKTSLLGRFKRIITAYTLKELPAEYAGEVLSIPMVVNEAELKTRNSFNIKKMVS